MILKNNWRCDFYFVYNEDRTFYGSDNPELNWACFLFMSEEYGLGYEMEAIQYDRHTNSFTGTTEHRSLLGIATEGKSNRK